MSKEELSQLTAIQLVYLVLLALNITMTVNTANMVERTMAWEKRLVKQLQAECQPVRRRG